MGWKINSEEVDKDTMDGEYYYPKIVVIGNSVSDTLAITQDGVSINLTDFQAIQLREILNKIR